MAKMTQIGKSIATSTMSTTNDDLSVPTTKFVRDDRNYPQPTLITGNTASQAGFFNGSFDKYPTFVAVQTASNWINGTAAGSATDDSYGWFFSIGANNCAVRYDTTVTHSGGASIKLSNTNTVGQCRVFNVGTITVDALSKNAPVIKPSTKYRLSGWVKTYNVASNAAYIQYRQYDADAVMGSTTNTTQLTGTNDWAYYKIEFTSDSDAKYIFIALHNYAAGNVSDAWYDDIKLEEVIEDTGYTGTSPTSLISTISGVTSLDNIDIDKIDGNTVTTYVTYGWIGQQFTASKTNIGQIGLRLLRNGAAAQTMMIAVEGDTGSNAPNGVTYAYLVFDCSTLVDDNTLHEIILDLPCILTSGTKYWVTTKISALTNNVGFGVLAGTYTEYRSYGASSWATSNTTAQYDIRIYNIKRTNDITVVCNGEKISLNTNEDGILHGAIIDLNKGKYIYEGVNATEYEQITDVYDCSTGTRTDSFRCLKQWTETIVLRTATFYALVGAAAVEQYITWKINTLLPIKHVNMITNHYTNNTAHVRYVQVSTNNIDWITIGTETGISGHYNRTYNTDDLNGLTTFYIRAYNDSSANLMGFAIDTLDIDLDVSSVPSPIIYPLAANQFTEEIVAPADVTRIYYREDKFINKNGVTCANLELTNSTGVFIKSIPIPIDNTYETDPAININIAGTTNAQQSGTGSNDSTTGYILNDGEYMTLSTAVSTLKITYSVGTGTTSFGNITKNIIYVSSNGDSVSLTKRPSLQVAYDYWYRVQSITRTITDLTNKVNDVNNRTQEGVWREWTPTLTWTTANPESPTTVARWTKIGNTVFYTFSTSTTDGNGATALTVSLPIPMGGQSLFHYSHEVVSSTRSDPIAYITTSVNTLLRFATFSTWTNGVVCSIYASGFYEIV